MEKDMEPMDHFDISDSIERERERETLLFPGENIPNIKSFAISECCSFGLRKKKTKQKLYATTCTCFNFYEFLYNSLRVTD